MKIKLFIVAFIVVIALLFPQSVTPYSGKYYDRSTNRELVLNADTSFNFNIIGYKNNTTISGKYKISNNHIDLIANDYKESVYIKAISSGEVTGSVITFSQSEYGPTVIYEK